MPRSSYCSCLLKRLTGSDRRKRLYQLTLHIPDPLSTTSACTFESSAIVSSRVTSSVRCAPSEDKREVWKMERVKRISGHEGGGNWKLERKGKSLYLFTLFSVLSFLASRDDKLLMLWRFRDFQILFSSSSLLSSSLPFFSPAVTERFERFFSQNVRNARELIISFFFSLFSREIS